MYKNGKYYWKNNTPIWNSDDLTKSQTKNTETIYIFFSYIYIKGVLNVLEGSDREINMEPGIAEKDI